jgi:hypothetical protein
MVYSLGHKILGPYIVDIDNLDARFAKGLGWLSTGQVYFDIDSDLFAALASNDNDLNWRAA